MERRCRDQDAFGEREAHGVPNAVRSSSARDRYPAVSSNVGIRRTRSDAPKSIREDALPQTMGSGQRPPERDVRRELQRHVRPSRKVGKRADNSSRTIRACSRASPRPRQKCVPCPKDRWSLAFGRRMSKQSGSGNTSGFLLPELSSRTRLAPAEMGVSASVVSHGDARRSPRNPAAAPPRLLSG